MDVIDADGLTFPISALTRGSGVQPVRSARQLERTVDGALRSAGFPDRRLNVFPSALVTQSTYIPALVEVARAYAEVNDTDGVKRALRTVLAIDPENDRARKNLEIANQQGQARGPVAPAPAAPGPVAPASP